MRKWDSWPLSDLVLCETHLNDAGGVRLGIVRVLLVLLPPQEVGRVLSMGVARGLPGEQLLRHYENAEVKTQVSREREREREHRERERQGDKENTRVMLNPRIRDVPRNRPASLLDVALRPQWALRLYD
ncbi:hypothetical protein BHM03_00054371 [Ensete ventricosum]|nr:hypothetical protein BHM03_00054371 [Ensete ventricosum]